MLQPELKFRRDKIRSLMALQGIDAALITCNTNLIIHTAALSAVTFIFRSIHPHCCFSNVPTISQANIRSLSANRNRLSIC